MKQQFYDAIVDGPIIAAVKDETGVEVCIQTVSYTHLEQGVSETAV